MLIAGGHADQLVALGIEGDRADVRPVTGVAGPTCWVALPGLDVEVVASRQDGLVVAGVALLRADISDAAVAMIDVVPTHEFASPGPGLVQTGEAFGREVGPVLGRAEQRLGVGVVVADTRARVRGLDAQPVQHRQHRGGLQRGAVVAMKHGLGVNGGDALGQRRAAHQVHSMVRVVTVVNLGAHDLAAVQVQDQVVRPEQPEDQPSMRVSSQIGVAQSAGS